MSETLNQVMRRELVRGAGVMMAGAGNALAARVIEAAGFKTMMVSGAAVANTYLGVPDIGLVSVTELAGHVAAVRDSVGIPILADADTGFGNAINARRTVQLLERAGANAIMLEDQTYPKRCGHFEGKDVIPRAEMVSKLKAAVDARVDPDLMILARTDARAVEGFEAALDRARAYQEAGADFLFVEAPLTKEELLAIPREVPGIHLCNMVIGGKTPLLPRAELAKAGYAVICYANAALQASLRAMQDVLQHLHRNGSIDGVEDQLMMFAERQKVLDADKYTELEKEIRMTGPARTFFDKVWDDHVALRLGEDADLLQIDRLVLHELSGSQAVRALAEAGRKPMCRGQVFTVIEHLISTRPGRGPNESVSKSGPIMIETTRKASREWGFHFIDYDDPRQGIAHVVAPELGIAFPGATLVCCDSHTSTVGGVGALAWGIGATEAEHVLATQTLAQGRPKRMRVNFEGALGAGVYAKDMILALIGQVGAQGGIGYAVEFAGAVVRALPIEARLTICNMSIEFSAKYGFVPPDESTIEFLEGREFSPKGAAWDAAVAYWRTLPSDPGATFDREVSVDCDALGPQVTWGTSPQQVASIEGVVPRPGDAADQKALGYMHLEAGTALRGIPIDVAYIGSCTNARLSDLRAAAAVLKGRKVKAGVQALCVPGSTPVKRAAEAEGLDRIFREAGFEWHESACGFCGHIGDDRFSGLRVVSTTNRNFEGRQGPNTRTHLASPATVAASAIEGCIADVRRHF